MNSYDFNSKLVPNQLDSLMARKLSIARTDDNVPIFKRAFSSFS